MHSIIGVGFILAVSPLTSAYRSNMKTLLLYVIHAGLRYIRGLSPVRIDKNSAIGSDGLAGVEKSLVLNRYFR